MCDIDISVDDGYDYDMDIETDISEGTDSEFGEDNDFEESSDYDMNIESDISEETDFEFEENSDAESSEVFDFVLEENTDMSGVGEYRELNSESDAVGEMDSVEDIFAMNEFQEEMKPEYLEQADNPEDWMTVEGFEQIIQNENNFEFLNGLRENLISGNISVMEEGVNEEDSPKVLTREIIPEILESREQDTETVLENYRENLRNYGIDEECIEEFIDVEREKIQAEYNSLDSGNTSSDIYYMPTEWEETAERLRGQEVGMEELADNETVDEEDMYTELLESETTEEGNIEFPESEITEEENLETLENDIIEEEPMECLVSDILEETKDIAEEEILSETEEIDINYDEIYEEIQREAFEQGFTDISIDTDPERLEDSLNRFEESVWETLSMDEQKESMENLYDYVSDIIGFENPPAIEYYNNERKGDFGGYNASTNTLRINEYMLYDSSEAADTIAHELWHAHQHECAMKPQSARDYQYQYNFENYITPELGQKEYESQLVEAEARAFAAQFKERLAQKRGSR